MLFFKLQKCFKSFDVDTFYRILSIVHLFLICSKRCDVLVSTFITIKLI